LEKAKSKNQKFQKFEGKKIKIKELLIPSNFKNFKKPSSFMKDSLISKQLFDFFKK